MKVSTIIIGKRRSGKTRKAYEIANKRHSAYTYVGSHSLWIKSVFTFNPQVIIFDELEISDTTHIAFMNEIISMEFCSDGGYGLGTMKERVVPDVIFCITDTENIGIKSDYANVIKL